MSLSIIVDIFKLIYYFWRGILETVFPIQWVKSKQFEVRNKVAVVTGAGNGIGRAIALELAQKGSTVVLVDVSEDAIRSVAEEIMQLGGASQTIVCDVSNKNDIKKLAAQIRDSLGEVDVLVNNAGIAVLRSILDHSEADIERTLQINLHAHFWTIRAFLPGMIKRRSGHIVSIASIAGHCGCANVTAYCAAKFAVVGMHEALRLELESSGLGDTIGMTCVCPFYVKTRLLRGAKVGRGEFLMPPLDPQHLAQQVVKAIEYRKEMLLTPWAITLLVALHSTLPVKSLLCLSRLCGINEGLQNIPQPSTLTYLPAQYRGQ